MGTIHALAVAVAAAVLFLGLFLLLSVVRVKTRTTELPPRPASPAAAGRLVAHVEHLSAQIGPRSVHTPARLHAAQAYLAAELSALGLPPALQEVPYEGEVYHNLVVTLPGTERPDERVVFGAHYDTVAGTPGADDNASGVAVLLELGRALRDEPRRRTVELVFFALEEPPVFRTDRMGSHVYAAAARARGATLVGMVCLEMVGYYGHRKGDQAYPLPFMGLVYPSAPDFLAVVGNRASRVLVARVARALRQGCDLPVETLAAPAFLPGVDLSDHRSFWKQGYPAVMITDTAFYRNPNYHRPGDTADTLDYGAMARLVDGLAAVARELADGP